MTSQKQARWQFRPAGLCMASRTVAPLPSISLVAQTCLILHVYLRFADLVRYGFGALLYVPFKRNFFGDARLLVDHSFLTFPLRFNRALPEGVLGALQRSV